MTLSQWLSHYGYRAVFIGGILEGETILILAGFAAHQGYLSFPLRLALAPACSNASQAGPLACNASMRGCNAIVQG